MEKGNRNDASQRVINIKEGETPAEILKLVMERLLPEGFEDLSVSTNELLLLSFEDPQKSAEIANNQNAFDLSIRQSKHPERS